MEELVSVCLPVFNGAKFLSSAIECALKQTYTNCEILIADDCSTDESVEIIQQYAEQDSRIKFWRNPTRLGLFANYNACLSRAKGDFIKPFAQDDLWEPNMVSQCASVLRNQSDVSLVSSARKVINGKGETIKDLGIITAIDLLGKHAEYSGLDMTELSLNPLRNIIGEPCTVMFRSEFIGEGFSTDLRQIGDVEYWLRILQHGNYAFIKDELATFRYHKDGTSVTNNGQLWLASDIIHMSYACESALRKIGLTRQKFVRENLIWLSIQLNRLIDSGELNEKRLHRDNQLRREDLIGLKEALFHTMLICSDSFTGGGSTYVNTVDVLRKELKIRLLESKLRLVMGSFSWTSTRIFRELNKALGVGAEVEDSGGAVGLEEQDQYICYLHETLQKVFKSRSWKMARAVRQKWNRMSRTRNKFPANKLEPTTPRTKLSHRNKYISASTISATLPAEQSSKVATQKVRPAKRIPSRYKYHLAIGTICQNEAPYLKEWLEFHTLVGVEKFYLFNNLSTDNTLEVLEPYIRDGRVEFFDWPIPITKQEDFNMVQCSALRRIVDIASEQVKWLALTDVDEFLFPTEEDTLTDLLDEYEQYGGLSINWQMFGTSNCRRVPEGRLSIEMLTRCAATTHDVNYHVKTISRPEHIMKVTNPHFAKYVPGMKQVGEDEVPFMGSRSTQVNVDRIRINHYWTRDEHDFTYKKLPRLKDYNAHISEKEVQQRLLDFNETEDFSIQRYVPRLREAVFGGKDASGAKPAMAEPALI